MAGSNWPVVELGGTYAEVWHGLTELIAGLTPAERAAVLGGSAQPHLSTVTQPDAETFDRRSRFMFRHMAILKFKPDAKQADIDAYFKAFPGLMASLPVIKAWNIGRNQGAGGETHVKKA